jgi:hypothetical protein
MAKKTKARVSPLAHEVGLLRKVQGMVRTASLTQTDRGSACMLFENEQQEMLSLLDGVCDRLLSKRR